MMKDGSRFSLPAGGVALYCLFCVQAASGLEPECPGYYTATNARGLRPFFLLKLLLPVYLFSAALGGQRHVIPPKAGVKGYYELLHVGAGN